jgi:hypothetical protein
LDVRKDVILKDPGDVTIMRSHFPHYEEPEHEVTKVTAGVRYSIMLCSVYRANSFLK